MDSRPKMAADTAASGADFAPMAPFRCDGELRAQLATVLGLFHTASEPRLDDRAARHFLEAAEALAAWAARGARPTLAQTLRQTAVDFRALYDSPLDLDRQSRDLLWQRLAPELAALRHESPDAATAESAASTVPVRPERLEALVERVSHLSLTAELFRDLETRLAAARMPAALLDEMQQINRQLKTQATAIAQGVVALRRVPLDGALAAAAEHAHRLAAAAGKRLDFRIDGGATEIDPALLEKVGAVLTRLVEHAVPAARKDQLQRSGPAEAAPLRLEAQLRGSRICLSLRDNGLQSEHGDLSALTALVEQLDGELQVASSEEGTTIHLGIPQRDTVQAIDTLVVEHTGQYFAIPFDRIVEIVELRPEDLKPVQGRQVVALRGAIFDALSLSEVLHLEGSGHSPRPCQGILVQGKRGSLCLLVERVLGHRQAVVQPLDGLAAGNPRLAGVSPLGGGRLALVLAIPAILESLLG